MGGTSYESNNVFKLINRQGNRNIPGKEQSMSPPLKPIEEIIQKLPQKILIGASSTQSKFFQPSQQSRNAPGNVLIRNKRTTNEQGSALLSRNDNDINHLKSYNITQEKFFPNKQQQQPSIQNIKMHQSFYNPKNNELLEFNKKHNNLRNNRQSQENMIKEHEEISEEEEDADEDEPVNRKVLLEANSDQLPIAAYPMGDATRPSNRLGCSRAFNQTKDGWRGGEATSAAHSQPRNGSTIQGQETGGDSGQYSCKATSSATSLNIINKHYQVPAAQQYQQVSQQPSNSSVSPKPFHKWGGGNKIQEMQKEVNMMYLGGVGGAARKKAGAGVKLNPIARPQAAEPRSNYVL